MSKIHFIGGEKGGIGKSLFSRLLSQYFIDHKKTFLGLDADQSHGTYSRFYQEFTQPIDLLDFESVDTIINLASENDQHIVIDLPAQSQKFLDKWLEENDVFSLCEELKIQPIFWQVVDDGVDSQNLLENFINKYADKSQCIVVKNKGRGTDFRDIEAMTFLQTEEDSLSDNTSLLNSQINNNDIKVFKVKQIYLPELHISTLRKIDKLNLSFWAASHAREVEAKGITVMESHRTKVWLQKVYNAVNDVIPQ